MSMQRNTLLSLLPRTVAFGLFLAHVAAPIGLDMAEGPALTVKAAHAQMRDRQQMRDGSCRTADCLNRQQLDRLRLGQEGVTPRTDRPAADGERPIYGSQMMTEQ